MKNLITLITGLGICGLAISQDIDKNLIGTSGDIFQSGNYQLDWSIGEIQTETFPVNDATLTQGFHQGEYTILSEIGGNLGSQIEVTVFPNPTTDIINVKIKDVETQSLQCKITDALGKELSKIYFKDKLIQFNFTKYSSGLYYISLLEHGKTMKTYKLIKN